MNKIDAQAKRLAIEKESKIERRVKDVVEKRGGFCFKIESPGWAGFPDRLCIQSKNRVCFVETKSKTGKLSPLQKSLHRVLKEFGVKVYVVSNEQELKQFENEISGA